MVCRNSTREFLPYEQFFKTEDFIRSLYALDEVRDLMKHIDCQICHCGVLMVNETMYSKQKCEQCKRWFCFFCNKDWKEEEMKNDQYTCHNHCVYETKLGYDLVPLVVNSQLRVPSRRCCPKCFTLGGYDAKCKYHQCSVCKHRFCFICLETEDQCSKDPLDYMKKCKDVKFVFEELTDGTTYTASLIHSFTLDHFRNSVPVLGDLGKYRLLIDDTQLCLDNENIFNTQKRLLYNGVKVTLLDRTYNGTLIEKTLLKEIVLEDLKTELPKLTKVTAVCMFCMCQEQCSIIHCTHVCADCFNNYLEQTDMQLKCLKESRNPADEKRICNTVVEYKTFFKTPEFIDKWSILCDIYKYGLKMVLNLTFTLLAGKTIVKQINEDIQREEFIDIVSHFIANTDAHRFIVNGKQLDLCDDENFEKQKRFLLKNGTTVYVLERMIGGGFVEMSMLIAIILGEMEQELHKLETSMDNESPCAVCKEEPVCLKLCCNRVCKECFCMYFDSCNLKLRCMVCKRQIPYEQIFKTAEFIKSLESLDEIRDLMKHIDCQICRCEEEELCKTKYQSNYQHKCTDLKEQHFKDFSTIIQH
ncbi:unnamed protein product [Didymodactylos carnosus]|uniref:Uncharacterized protein n=1 Tax=Didymodactylos carnosus TaxID=1234261 RepID=A0A814U7B2_9BILA|nr:unnamed protein product [Didymodactylos carnosus]CAF3933825.1 unnamed protein product [Didymodactylos carnosus]